MSRKNFDEIALSRTVKETEANLCFSIFWQKFKIANLTSKLNFYKLIPYPMDNCFTGRRDRSHQTSEKDVLYILPAGPITECAFARWRIVLHFLFTY